MMKLYLLVAGSYYYPSAGTDDWIGCFDTTEETLSKISIEKLEIPFKSGPRKGQIKEVQERTFVERLDGRKVPVDWYEIIDLEPWIRGKVCPSLYL